MRLLPEPVENLIHELSKLPSIGPRTAERLTFFLLKADPAEAAGLGQALLDLHSGLTRCEVCRNLATNPRCDICSDGSRDQNLLAVVEEPLDVVALERTGHFRGLYHVLGGAISPIDGIGPEQLEVKSLLKRLDSGSIKELILATNPSTEGEATALFIRRQLGPAKIKVTRLARGLPIGGDLEYADQITLGRALEGRQAF
ncbi:MAG TPA: recombination mediator RecR [Candidatus Saccharimonadales bacterium]|nr:recombination mediator RecR [Candidatus Saccharimonadales bacterium]